VCLRNTMLLRKLIIVCSQVSFLNGVNIVVHSPSEHLQALSLHNFIMPYLGLA
jgi:hypothetical protein